MDEEEGKDLKFFSLDELPDYINPPEISIIQ